MGAYWGGGGAGEGGVWELTGEGEELVREGVWCELTGEGEGVWCVCYLLS